MEELNASVNTEPLAAGSKKLINGIDQDVFDKLNDEQKGLILSGHIEAQNKAKEGGWVGKAIGTNVKNASINIAFILILLLLIYCALDMIGRYLSCKEFKYELFEIVLPVITLALGYIFGKK